MNPVNSLRDALLSEKVERVVSRPGFMKWAIAGFIMVNMVTRPLFVMLDRETPKKDRAFSAERLAFQEMLSLGCHLGIASSFERLGAWLGSKLYAKSTDNPFMLKTSGQVYNLADWSGKAEQGWKAALKHKTEIEKQIKAAAGDSAALAKLAKQKIEIPAAVSGSMRAGSIAGTILALGVVAPWLNNLMLPVFVKGVDALLGKASGGRIKLSPDESPDKAANVQNSALKQPHKMAMNGSAAPLFQSRSPGVSSATGKPFTPPKAAPRNYPHTFGSTSPLARL